MQNVEKLPQMFEGKGEVKGYNFLQIDSNENGYLYKVYNEYEQHFEVIKKISSPVCINFEKRIYSETEFKETYPKANSFGISGWTYNNLIKASEKLQSLV